MRLAQEGAVKATLQQWVEILLFLPKIGGRSALHYSASPRHSVDFLQGKQGRFRFTGFSLKHSRAHFISAEFSPKQKPSGISHRGNQRT